MCCPVTVLQVNVTVGGGTLVGVAGRRVAVAVVVVDGVGEDGRFVDCGVGPGPVWFGWEVEVLCPVAEMTVCTVVVLAVVVCDDVEKNSRMIPWGEERKAMPSNTTPMLSRTIMIVGAGCIHHRCPFSKVGGGGGAGTVSTGAE